MPITGWEVVVVVPDLIDPHAAGSAATTSPLGTGLPTERQVDVETKCFCAGVSSWSLAVSSKTVLCGPETIFNTSDKPAAIWIEVVLPVSENFTWNTSKALILEAITVQRRCGDTTCSRTDMTRTIMEQYSD